MVSMANPTPTMTSRSIALFFAMTFAVAAVSAVSITYYSDANCATKATLPGGVSNPIVAALNTCSVLGPTSSKYTTCSASAGVTQQDYSDTSCNTKNGDPTVIPGAGIGLCVPFPGSADLPFFLRAARPSPQFLLVEPRAACLSPRPRLAASA